MESSRSPVGVKLGEMKKYVKMPFWKICWNPVGILLDSRSPVGIGGGVISTGKRCGKDIFFWSVGVSGVLVLAKKLVIFCTGCNHLGRAIGCIGELSSGAHCW